MIAAHPDWTLDEIVMAMEKKGIPGKRSAVWRFFQRHKITVKKKSLRAAEQERADVVRARRRWMREQGLFDPAHLVLSTRLPHPPIWRGGTAAASAASAASA